MKRTRRLTVVSPGGQDCQRDLRSGGITRCLEEVLLVDLVEPLPAKVDPAGPDSIVRCRWFPKPVRELKVLQGVNTGLSQKLLLEFAETEILSE